MYVLKLSFTIKVVFIIGLSFSSFAFPQEAQIALPEVTTYIPSSVEQKLVITAQEIEEAHYENMSQLVEGSGIQMLSYGPYGLENKPSVRGFTDETVRVVIDGICVNNAQYGTFDLSSINLHAVERVEIVKGGFTEGVEDEGSVGGVIYITMKKQELQNSLTADTALKTFFNSRLPLDSVFQKLSYQGRLGDSTFINSSGTVNYAANRYFYKVDKSSSLLDGPLGAALTSGKNGSWKTEENAGVIDGHANASLTHYFAGGNYFSISDIYYAGHKNTPGPVNSTNPGLQKDYNNNLTFSLWNPALAGGLFNLKNSLAWLCNNRFYKDSQEKENSTHYINTLKYTGTADFTSLAGGRLRQLIGLSADFTNLDSTNDGNHLQLSGVLKETTKYALGGGWSISLPMAAKFCINDDKENFAFVPKAGAAWESSSRLWRISADLYRMVQFPNMDDLFWVGGGFYGNPDLKPESGWGADLAASLNGLTRGSNSFNASLSVFSDYYKDKIRWGNGRTENLSSAFYLGLDFSAAASLASGFVDIKLNGEYLYNRLLDSNKYTYGKRIMWTPDFVCSSLVGLNFELVKITFSANYTGLRYTDNMNLYYLNPYLLLNILVEGSFIVHKTSWTPYLKADNILNWQYQSVDGYSMPGISITLGLRYKI